MLEFKISGIHHSETQLELPCVSSSTWTSGLLHTTICFHEPQSEFGRADGPNSDSINVPSLTL